MMEKLISLSLLQSMESGIGLDTSSEGGKYPSAWFLNVGTGTCTRAGFIPWVDGVVVMCLGKSHQGMKK